MRYYYRVYTYALCLHKVPALCKCRISGSIFNRITSANMRVKMQQGAILILNVADKMADDTPYCFLDYR